MFRNWCNLAASEELWLPMSAVMALNKSFNLKFTFAFAQKSDHLHHRSFLAQALASVVHTTAQPYSARKFTCHVMHRARALSTKMNNDRADGHCYSFAWI